MPAFWLLYQSHRAELTINNSIYSYRFVIIIIFQRNLAFCIRPQVLICLFSSSTQPVQLKSCVQDLKPTAYIIVCFVGSITKHHSLDRLSLLFFFFFLSPLVDIRRLFVEWLIRYRLTAISKHSLLLV